MRGVALIPPDPSLMTPRYRMIGRSELARYMEETIRLA
jgi:hypothetical protein